MELNLAKTKSAFLWTWLLRAPFWVVYNLLLFILYKDLKATSFQIALFIALKPVISIFSLYWSAYIHKRPDRILGNIAWGGVIGYFPFLFLPFFGGTWFLLFASTLFIMMHRGIVPGWIEVLKLNLPGEMKEKVFAQGSLFSYAIGSVLPFAIGPLLDHYPHCWRYLFFIFALMGLVTFFFQRKIPLPHIALPSTPKKVGLFESCKQPWAEVWELWRTKKDFVSYQVGFMILGGSGLMIMQPILPRFFVDVLGLSYTELSLALTLCKGVGFTLFSPLWAKLMVRINIFRTSCLVTFLATLFPLILFTAQYELLFVYIAYILYGIQQGGCELSWHLSGPQFSKNEESSVYTTMNVLTVGLRGLIIPQIGSLLACFILPSFLLIIGAGLSLAGSAFLFFHRSRFAPLHN